jgi:hypothetical protein
VQRMRDKASTKDARSDCPIHDASAASEVAYMQAIRAGLCNGRCEPTEMRPAANLVGMQPLTNLQGRCAVCTQR